MPHNCCVPFCNTSSKKNKNLRFHRFAKKKEQKELWISKIRRDEGEYFTVTSNTRVCSRHFREEDYTISEDGKGKRTVLKKGAVPSVFQWTTTKLPRSTLASKGKRKGGTLEVPRKKRRRENCQRCERKRTVIDKLETDLQNKNAQLKDLTENVEHLEKEKQDREQEVASSSMGNKHVCFSAENFRNQDKLIRFYTGIVNWNVFLQLFNFIEDRCKDLKYWRSDIKVDENHQQLLRQGRPRSLSMLDEYFLTLVRLRHAFPEEHLAYLFKVSRSTVSRVFHSWINLLYFELGSLPIWQSKDLIWETMPVSFKEKYSATRCILDCTEIKICKPSSLRTQSQCFSSYKNTTTAKGLLGIAPSGAPTFISDLYTGSISDKDITKQSGILELLEEGDECMADKGFNIKDLLEPIGVTLNIPPFLSDKGQFDGGEVENTQSIASVRIHVERAISRIKMYKIISNVVPLSLSGLLNQIWTVCGMLLLFQAPIINQESVED
ncbi:uncharacterized protein [Montipora foliosa]|uniref:uncharacterized protein n=1 Tax=Montipora foliosa TaxID=591990 RepID=UPI0035F18B2B